jgi:hypothetical protein
MAGMPWIRLQTTIFDNPKLLNLQADKQYRAIVTHFEAMTYCGRTGLAGYIPKVAIDKAIGALPADVKRLVAEGLWSVAPGGWQINGWEDYQVSDEDAIKRSEKAQRAAQERWRRERERNGETA